MRSKLTTSQNVQRCAADQPGNGRQHRSGQQCSKLVVAEPVISNANSNNRRSHNTAERINCFSKVLHVLEPPKTQPPSIIYATKSSYCLTGRRAVEGLLERI